MNCPYCQQPGIPRESEVYAGDTCDNWICVKCPNPVTYNAYAKKVVLWALYNDNWYSVVYMKESKEYVVRRENFELHINQDHCREEYLYRGSFTVQLPSEENVNPTNVDQKIALWLTFL